MREEDSRGRRGTSSKIREVAKKVIVVAASYACGSFSTRKSIVDPVTIDTSCNLSATVCTTHFHFHFPSSSIKMHFLLLGFLPFWIKFQTLPAFYN
jgi:hypothetical protein